MGGFPRNQHNAVGSCESAGYGRNARASSGPITGKCSMENHVILGGKVAVSLRIYPCVNLERIWSSGDKAQGTIRGWWMRCSVLVWSSHARIGCLATLRPAPGTGLQAPAHAQGVPE